MSENYQPPITMTVDTCLPGDRAEYPYLRTGYGCDKWKADILAYKIMMEGNEEKIRH